MNKLFPAKRVPQEISLNRLIMLTMEDDQANGYDVVVISGKEIVGKMKNGEPIDYNNVIIIDNIDLRNLMPTSPNSKMFVSDVCGVVFDNEAKLVSSTIRITNSRILGEIFAANIIFENTVDFLGTTFNRFADFGKTYFLRKALFDKSTFCSEPLFNNTTFFGKASFNKALFYRDATFEESCFKGIANFENSDFRKKVSFLNADFRDFASFDHAEFNDSTDFGNTHFAEGVRFEKSRFGAPYFEKSYLAKKISFRVTRIDRIADFKEAVFYGVADFVGSEFRDLAFFRDCKFFWGEARFVDAIFRGYANFGISYFNRDFNLQNAEIDGMGLLDITFGRGAFINLSNSKYSKLDLFWKALDENLDYRQIFESDYLALIENLKKLGQHDEADDCYYKYRNFLRIKKKWGLSRSIDEVAFLSCGYGVRPGYVIFWIFMFIFIFALFFCFLNNNSFPDGLYLSGMTFTTSLPGNLSSAGNLKYAVVAERTLGTLLLSLFIVVLTKKLIR